MLRVVLFLLSCLFSLHLHAGHTHAPPPLDFSKIRNENPLPIIEYLQMFPRDAYQIYSVPLESRVIEFSPHLPRGGVIQYYIDSVPDCIKNMIRTGKPWETHFNELIALHAKPGSVVLDIGAHIGTHTILLSKVVGPRGQVHAFEPQPKTFRELFFNLQLNRARNVQLYNAAVGAVKGNIEISALSDGNEGAASVGPGVDTGQFAELLAIDDLNLTNVSLIKIDVEGMEMEILRGAAKTIARERPILLIEICGGSLPETASPEIRDEIYRRRAELEGMGYYLDRLFGYWDYLAYPLEKVPR